MTEARKRDDVTVLLVAVVGRLLEILVSRVELDAAKGVRRRYSSIGVDPCVSNRRRKSRCCGACRRVAIKLDACVCHLGQSGYAVFSIGADGVVYDGWERGVYLQCVRVHSLTDDGRDSGVAEQLASECFADRRHSLQLSVDDVDAAAGRLGGPAYDLDKLDAFED